jgi:hypothetical protein
MRSWTGWGTRVRCLSMRCERDAATSVWLEDGKCAMENIGSEVLDRWYDVWKLPDHLCPEVDIHIDLSCDSEPF